MREEKKFMIKKAKIRIPALFLAFFLILTLCPQNVKADTFDTSYIISHNVRIAGGNFGEIEDEYGQKIGDASLSLTLSYDPRWLTVLPSYNCYPELAKFASIISAGTYGGVSLLTDGVGGVGELPALLESFGFKNYSRQSVTSPDGKDLEDVTEVIMASREDVIDNTEYTTFVIIVMGTNGIEQWSSNFDVGDPDEFGTDLHPDWKNINNHKGFDVTANRANLVAETYMNQYQKSGSQRRVLYTGHSRGAGVANILGSMHPSDSIAYTFAAPNTTTAPIGYSNIHNIVNSNDLVSSVPTSHMGYSRYGQDIIYDASSNREVQNIIESSGVTYVAADLTDVIAALNRIWDKIINIEDYDIEDFDDDMDSIEQLLFIADATGSTGDIFLIVMELLSQMPALKANHYVVASLAIVSLIPEPAAPAPIDPTPDPGLPPIISGGGSITSAIAPPNATGTIGGGNGGTDIKVYINNGEAIVSNISANTISNIAASPETSIIIDVSNITDSRKKVSKVSLTKITVGNIVDVLLSPGNNKDSITIIMDTTAIKIDAKALSSILDQARGANIQFVLQNKSDTRLNESQEVQGLRGGIENKEVVEIFETHILSAGKEITDFGGGKVSVGLVGFKIPEGKNPRNFHIYYLPDTGNPVLCITWVEDGILFFQTGNFL